MRGPQPKPNAIRRIEHVGRYPVNDKEPKPDLIIQPIPAPPQLKEGARTIWEVAVAELAKLSLLTVIDLNALMRYCNYMNEYLECERIIDGKYFSAHYVNELDGKDAEGHDKFRKVLSYSTPHPLVSIRDRAAEMCRKLEDRFGMSPAARARMISFVQNPQQRSDLDPYADC